MGTVFKRGEKYYFAYMDKGRQVTRPGVKDRATTERICAEVERTAALRKVGLLPSEDNKICLKSVMDRYLDHCSTCRRKATIQSIRLHLQRFQEGIGVLSVDELSLQRVEQYLEAGLRGELPHQEADRKRRASLRTKRIGWSVRSANICLGYLKRMLDWAVSRRLIGSNPLKEIKPFQGQRVKSRREIAPDELTRFLEASPEPYKSIWTTFLETGLRHGELTSLTWGDVDFFRNEIRIRSEISKTHRERLVPLSTTLQEMLKCRMQGILSLDPGDLVFPNEEGKRFNPSNLLRSFKRSLARAKISNHDNRLDIHALRVSFASALAREGVPVVVTQKLLGHASPAMTLQVYTKINQEDARKAVAQLPFFRKPAAVTTENEVAKAQ